MLQIRKTTHNPQKDKDMEKKSSYYGSQLSLMRGEVRQSLKSAVKARGAIKRSAEAYKRSADWETCEVYVGDGVSHEAVPVGLRADGEGVSVEFYDVVGGDKFWVADSELALGALVCALGFTEEEAPRCVAARMSDGDYAPTPLARVFGSFGEAVDAVLEMMAEDEPFGCDVDVAEAKAALENNGRFRRGENSYSVAPLE